MYLVEGSERGVLSALIELSHYVDVAEPNAFRAKLIGAAQVLDCVPMSVESNESEAQRVLDGGFVGGSFEGITKHSLGIVMATEASVEIGEVDVGRGERWIGIDGLEQDKLCLLLVLFVRRFVRKVDVTLGSVCV